MAIKSIFDKFKKGLDITRTALSRNIRSIFSSALEQLLKLGRVHYLAETGHLPVHRSVTHKRLHGNLSEDVECRLKGALTFEVDGVSGLVLATHDN